MPLDLMRVPMFATFSSCTKRDRYSADAITADERRAQIVAEHGHQHLVRIEQLLHGRELRRELLLLALDLDEHIDLRIEDARIERLVEKVHRARFVAAKRAAASCAVAVRKMIGTCAVRGLPRISSASSKPSMPGMLTSRIASATSCLSSSSSAAGPDSAFSTDEIRPCQRRFERGDVVADVVDDQNVDGLRHQWLHSLASDEAGRRSAPPCHRACSISCAAPCAMARERHRGRARRRRVLHPAVAARMRGSRARRARRRRSRPRARRRAAARDTRAPPIRTARPPTAAKSARADRPTARSTRSALDQHVIAGRREIDRAGRDLVLVVRLDDGQRGSARRRVRQTGSARPAARARRPAPAGAKPSGSAGSSRLSASMPPADAPITTASTEAASKAGCFGCGAHRYTFW